jgi:recombinational DNA repair protein RecR
VAGFEPLKQKGFVETLFVMQLGPQASLVATALIAVVMMIRLGIVKGMLESRRAMRNCRSCGRRLEGRSCAICAQRDRR